MDNNKTSIIFFGSGDFPYPTFKTIVENEVYDVKGLVTSPYKPYFYSETLKDVAERNNIPVFSTHKPNCAELVEWLKEKETDIFCVISYKFLSNDILRIPKITAFNIHASLLPFFKGAAPINWAIRCGMKSTGLTSFVMDDKIDSGEIINNIKIPIEDSDDFGTIYNRLSVLSVGFTIDTIQRITAHRDWRRYLLLQPDYNLRDVKYMYAPKLTDENTRIPIKYGELPDSDVLYNHIRSLSPNIGTPCKLQVYKVYKNENTVPQYHSSLVKEYDIKIYQAHTEPMKLEDIFSSFAKKKIEGNIITDGKNYMLFRCLTKRAKYLLIDEIQMAGKKRMTIKDFLSGFQWGREKDVYLVITGE